MAEYKNFYETVKEAMMRLKDTVVLYDGKPYYVLTICDHKGDGIFRIYLDELGRSDGPAHHRHSIPYDWHDEVGGMSRGEKMDQWLEKNPDQGVIRKMMNSPKFNKFRPFSLGMCNYGGSTFYLERSPTRYTQQGLINAMVNYYELMSSGGKQIVRRGIPELTSAEFAKTVVGDYPSAKECITNLRDPEVVNTAAAFNRNFAFVKGPIGLLFLAYKFDVIGYMPYGDLSRVNIASEFRHTKEVVEELKLFEDIRV